MLVLTTFDLDEYVYDALRAGASGFLLKDAPPSQLVDAIRVVAAGEALLAPAITRRLIEELRPRRRRPGDAAGALAELTDRELEVLRLIARGLLQRRDRRGAVPQRGDGQDPRHAHPARSSACATASRPSCSPTRPASSGRENTRTSSHRPTSANVNRRRLALRPQA